MLENTLIVFFTDHGLSHARGKQFLYDEGTHIPLVIRGRQVQAGHVRTDLVEHIDIAALSLAAAGITIPDWMQGQDILAKDFHPKHAVFAARDRCGEAVDQIRSVRSENYLYIKNFFPSRPHLMPSNYKDSKLIIQRLRELHADEGIGQLGREALVLTVPSCGRTLFVPPRQVADSQSGRKQKVCGRAGSSSPDAQRMDQTDRRSRCRI